MGQPVFNPPPCNSVRAPGSNPPSFIPRGAYPAKSKREQNAERQREFRERNPGYYGRLHAKRRAETKARYAEYLAAERLKAQETATVELQETATVELRESVPVVAQEPVHIAPTIAEPVKPTPVKQSTLPPQEAMLLLMLMAAVARLQKQRAEAWE